jgi:hypothetical protein
MASSSPKLVEGEVVMLKKLLRNPEFHFFCAFVFALFMCTALAFACITHGQSMAATHTDEQYSIPVLLGGLALSLAIGFAVMETTRKWYWFSIPLLLVAFSVLCFKIASQFPCCVGG